MISGDAPNGATGSYDGGTAGGSANALTATVSGLGSSPSTGNVVILKTSAANTGAATLAINSGSAIAIKNQDGTTALAGGEMASAKYYLLEYNGTNWVLLNPVVSASDVRSAKYASTTGGAVNYILTLPTFTLAAGVEVSCKFNVVNGAACTLNVNGTGDIAIKQFSQGGYVDLPTSFIGTTQILQLVYTGLYWQITNVLPLVIRDLPFTGTKDSSTFARGDGVMSNGVSGTLFASAFVAPNTSSGAILRASTPDGSDNQYTAIVGGGGSPLGPGSVQTRGANAVSYGNEHPTFPGVFAALAGEAGYHSFYNAAGVEAVRFTGGEIRIPSGNTAAGSSSERWIGPRSGSTVSLFQNAPSSGSHGFGVNGSESFRVDANGPRGDSFTPLTASNAVLRTNTSATSDTLKAQMAAASAVDSTRGAINEVVGINATNEAGANIRRATGKLQAASTSANLVAVAATDCGHVGIIDNNTGGETARVNIKNGAITSITGDTTTYVTTSPTSAQCQITISGGYLVGTTGSGWAYKAGTMPNLVRMV